MYVCTFCRIKRNINEHISVRANFPRLAGNSRFNNNSGKFYMTLRRYIHQNKLYYYY